MSHYGSIGPAIVSPDDNQAGTTVNDPAENTYTAGTGMLAFDAGPYLCIKNTGGANALKYVLTGYYDRQESMSEAIQASTPVAFGATDFVQITKRYHHVKWEIDSNVDGNHTTFQISIMGLSLNGRQINYKKV